MLCAFAPLIFTFLFVLQGEGWGLYCAFAPLVRPFA
jgi:hypothetical protein